ncbi:MAG: YecH family metal-binding protein [Psychromonas sp.]
MNESIHGHQVMELMASSTESHTESELLAIIASTFGENARFHTCMDENLTSKNLIDFLTSKGKLVESDQGLSLALNNSC